ncbi:helix-turn-helix domain-containing protein, partial [Eisenbergiella massiliensis]
GKPCSTVTIDRLCTLMDCDVPDIITFKKD